MAKIGKPVNNCYNKYLEYIKETEEEYEELRDKLSEISDNRRKVLEDSIDLLHKYIYIEERDSYIYVSSIFKHGNKLIIRGYGFYYEFTKYDDATVAHWNWMFDHDIHLDSGYTIEEQFKKIREITKEEFEHAFSEMMNGIKEHHKYILDWYEKHKDDEN